MTTTKRRVALLGALLTGALAVACSSSTSSAPDGGKATGTGTSTATSTSTGTCDDAGTLYSRLGGHAGIRTAINAVVAKELMDPNIASYFFNQVANPIPAGHPSAGEIEECFTDLLASKAGGPEVYPPAGGAFDDGGNGGTPGTFMCRDMTTIHQPLLISGGTFDQFVTIAAGVLQSAGVNSCDIATIGGVLESTRSSIVDGTLNDAGLQPYPGDAGGQ